MNIFRVTTYLSEILEESRKRPVIVFKYSSECGTSDRIADILTRAVTDKAISAPIYKVIVQKHPVLSKSLEEFFTITHESPQIIIIKDGKAIYTAHHSDIDVRHFVFE